MTAPYSVCFRWSVPDYQFCSRAHRGPVCGFLVFWLQNAIELLLCIVTLVLFIVCVSLWYFIEELEYPYADRTYIRATSELRVRFRANKTCLSLPRATLSFPRPRFFCCSSLFLRLWFGRWRLCCPYCSFFWCLGMTVLDDCAGHFLDIFTYVF